MGTPKGTKPWNAGTSKGWTDRQGYRWIYVTENGRQRARREHRVVMERALGRRLEPWELVHHKDENPSNNVIENLEVRQFGEHTAEHHQGSKQAYATRKSIEAFGLLRGQLEHERAVRAYLYEALIVMQRLCDEALPKFDWGKSALDANAIRLLNEAPLVASAALARARGGQS